MNRRQGIYTPLVRTRSMDESAKISGHPAGREGGLVHVVQAGEGMSSTETGQLLNWLLIERQPYVVCLDTAGIQQGSDKVNTEADIVDGEADMVIAFSMGATYLLHLDSPVYLVSAGSEPLLQLVRTKCIEQAFGEPYVIKIPGGSSRDNLFILDETFDFATIDAQFIHSLLGKYVLALTNDADSAIKLHNRFGYAIAQFLQEPHPGGRLLIELVNITGQLDDVTEQNKRLTAELSIANSFVELSKSKYKSDYERLFEFYHREYEALPSWYKKFGHVIKVMMGKRTFKSLFNDDHKQHKT